MAAAAQVRITLCPPAQAHSVDVWKQHVSRQVKPVHKPEENEDGSFQNGLSFDDYRCSQTQTHKLAASRRYEPPSWALDNKKTALVICVSLETQAFSEAQHKRLRKGLSLGSRLRRAQQKLLEKIPNLQASQERICAEYVALKCSAEPDRAKLRVLERQIATIDSECMMLRHPAEVLCSIVWRYYRLGWKSGEVAREISCHAPFVRQRLRRLDQAAEKCGLGEVRRSTVSGWERQQTKRQIAEKNGMCNHCFIRELAEKRKRCVFCRDQARDAMRKWKGKQSELRNK